MPSNKPRILRIINRLNLGGPTFNAAYLSKYLETDFDTMLVSGMKDDAEESSEFIVKNLDLHPVYIPEMYRELNPLRDYKSYYKLKNIIETFKPDIVHTHAAKAGAVGRLAAHHCGVKHIVHTYHGHVFHGYFSPAKTRFFLEIERYLATKTSKIIALSKSQKEELSDTYKIAPADKFEIIQLGFDLKKFTEDLPSKREAFREQYQIKADEIAIGIIGRLVPIKNHEMFLRAVHYVSTMTSKKIKAVIVGDGEERLKMEQLANELGLLSQDSHNKNTRVVFTGWRKDVDVCNAGLDIICLTSKNEGTPVSLIEAQASGKPIVSTRVGGIEDIVIENKTALLCKSEDIAQFSSHLLQLVERTELRSKMSNLGVDHVLSHFSYQRLCSDMATLYKSMLAG
ncbi:MAG: glycosyltransferase [Bacteroidetes bacterium]|nr:glycosyltransferase [Bacteroidota bacterium]MBK8658569.1 glycosyltransferase [Bacteroidota bacterium]